MKYIYFSKSLMALIGLVAFSFSLSACVNENDFAANISQPTDIATENVLAITSETAQPGSSPTIEPIITATPKLPIYITAHDARQHHVYSILHKKDGSLYQIDIVRDEEYKHTIKLLDENDTELQTIELDSCSGRMELRDVNTDGYADIAVNTGGTINETHDLYIWDPLSNNFVKVIYKGFEMLAWYSVHDGYIDNFIRGDTPEDSSKEKLIWQGNVLMKESEYTSK